VLGTSPASARYAADRGLPYAFGGFLDPRGMLDALAAYHQHFRPGPFGQRPRVMLAWYVQPADSEAEARHLARSTEHWFVQTFVRGGNPTFADPDQLAGERYGPMEELALAMRRQFALVGTAEHVLDGLEQLVKQTACDELMLVSIAHDPEARRHGYRLLAGARS
jgi:alkanesulfonate monooxygenase SsuD/methylene tetrahydromethanopterin reductase-like flavin-dependent oxidoreductase (luciferase family)